MSDLWSAVELGENSFPAQARESSALDFVDASQAAHYWISDRCLPVKTPPSARGIQRSVRVTLHRVRDNVATEAVEQVASGLSVASGVLGHIDKVNDEKALHALDSESRHDPISWTG